MFPVTTIFNLAPLFYHPLIQDHIRVGAVVTPLGSEGNRTMSTDLDLLSMTDLDPAKCSAATHLQIQSSSSHLKSADTEKEKRICHGLSVKVKPQKWDEVKSRKL